MHTMLHVLQKVPSSCCATVNCAVALAPSFIVMLLYANQETEASSKKSQSSQATSPAVESKYTSHKKDHKEPHLQLILGIAERARQCVLCQQQEGLPQAQHLSCWLQLTCSPTTVSDAGEQCNLPADPWQTRHYTIQHKSSCQACLLQHDKAGRSAAVQAGHHVRGHLSGLHPVSPLTPGVAVVSGQSSHCVVGRSSTQAVTATLQVGRRRHKAHGYSDRWWLLGNTGGGPAVSAGRVATSGRCNRTGHPGACRHSQKLRHAPAICGVLPDPASLAIEAEQQRLVNPKAQQRQQAEHSRQSNQHGLDQAGVRQQQQLPAAGARTEVCANGCAAAATWQSGQLQCGAAAADCAGARQAARRCCLGQVAPASHHRRAAETRVTGKLMIPVWCCC